MKNQFKPTRLCIYDYYINNTGNLIGDCISGKLESGIIKEKDELILMPLNVNVTVKAIEVSKVK